MKQSETGQRGNPQKQLLCFQLKRFLRVVHSLKHRSVWFCFSVCCGFSWKVSRHFTLVDHSRRKGQKNDTEIWNFKYPNFIFTQPTHDTPHSGHIVTQHIHSRNTQAQAHRQRKIEYWVSISISSKSTTIPADGKWHLGNRSSVVSKVVSICYVRVCVTAVRCVKCWLNECELEIFKMFVAFFWSLHVQHNFWKNVETLFIAGWLDMP